jgi:hypothetical protein
MRVSTISAGSDRRDCSGLRGCCSAYLGEDRGVSTAAEPAASTRPPVAMRPGCLWVHARLISGASGRSQDEFPIIATTDVGHATRTEVEVTSVIQSSRVVLGFLAVAKPGSTYGSGGPERMPADSVVRPENQLVRSDPVVDSFPAGQRLSVTFQATEPGIYGGLLHSSARQL